MGELPREFDFESLPDDPDLTLHINEARTPAEWAHLFKSTFAVPEGDKEHSTGRIVGKAVDLQTLRAFITYLEQDEPGAAAQLRRIAAREPEKRDQVFIKHCAEKFEEAVKNNALKIDRRTPTSAIL